MIHISMPRCVTKVNLHTQYLSQNTFPGSIFPWGKSVSTIFSVEKWLRKKKSKSKWHFCGETLTGIIICISQNF